jgi:hypothetical protein
MKRTSAPFLGVGLLLLVACHLGSGGDSASQSRPAPSVVGTFQPPPDSLEGEWHQLFTCEENVRTFQRNLSDLKNQEQRLALANLKGNNDTSVHTLLLEYTREFAWGPNAAGPIHGALTAAEVKPTSICRGATDRERSLRFQGGALVVSDWDGSIEGPASYEFVNDHIFTVNDGGQNFGCCPSRPIDTFAFRIDGERLTITMIGQDDPWGGTALEEAPWHRVN